MHVRSSVSKCSVCENTGGLIPHCCTANAFVHTLKMSVTNEKDRKKEIVEKKRKKEKEKRKKKKVVIIVIIIVVPKQQRGKMTKKFVTINAS